MQFKDKEIKVKPFSLRTIVYFETLAEHPFKVETTFDFLVWFYCSVVSVKENNDLLGELDFDGFVAYIDDNPDCIPEFQKEVEAISRFNDQFVPEEIKKK